MHLRNHRSAASKTYGKEIRKFIRGRRAKKTAATRRTAHGIPEWNSEMCTTVFHINNMHSWRTQDIVINGNELAFDADLLNHAISEVAEAGENNPCSSGRPVEVRSEQSRNLYTVIVDKDMFPAADLAVTNPVNGLCEQFNGIPDVGAWILTTESTARYGHAMHAWSR